MLKNDNTECELNKTHFKISINKSAVPVESECTDSKAEKLEDYKIKCGGV